MGYATAMVHLEPGKANKSLLMFAKSFARRFEAGVLGITACQPMQIVDTGSYFAGDLVSLDREECDRELKAAEDEFRTAFRGHEPVDWRSMVTYAPLADYLAYEARGADIVITGVDRDASIFDSSRHVDLGALVMQLGRPVLVVPAGIEELKLGSALVAWKDSGEARRAVRDALPLLKKAGRVTIAAIAHADDEPSAQRSLDDVAAWMKRHGIAAEALFSSSRGDDVGQLNDIANERRADLIVAGAYGHSRLREWVLGGVTRDLLLPADRCALLSH